MVSFNFKFDVGYFRGSQRICFAAGDNITAELQQLEKSGKCLWCDGLKPSEFDEPICLDSDSDDEGTLKTKKRKVDKEMNAYEAKAKRVDALANELRELHKEKFNKIQYKLWVEALDSGKHTGVKTHHLVEQSSQVATVRVGKRFQFCRCDGFSIHPDGEHCCVSFL